MAPKKRRGKKVDFLELQRTMAEIKEKRGGQSIKIEECPSWCPKLGDQKNCTMDTCIEVQKQVDMSSDVLRAFDAVGEDAPRQRDMGMRGNKYQQSRKFLAGELKEEKLRDGVRCYRLLEYDEKDREIIPTCRTTIYGTRGKSDTIIVMLETHNRLVPHIKRHGMPLNIPMDGGRRICLRDCKKCNRERRAINMKCKELELREDCEGCLTRRDASRETSDWFDEYCGQIGLDRDFLPYSVVRFVSRGMTKSKGEKWI